MGSAYDLNLLMYILAPGNVIYQPDAYLKSLDVAGEFSLVTLGQQDAVGNFLVCGHFCGMLARRSNDGME